MGMARALKRNGRKKMLRLNSPLVDKFCETEKYVQLAETIVKNKVSDAIEEMTRAQVIHEMRTAGCVNGVWMLALKDVFGFHSKRLCRVFERVMDMITYMNANKNRDQNVTDVIEAVADECGIEIDVPEGINDRRPLLFGGRAICYGALLGTVTIGGQEIAISADVKEVPASVQGGA